MLSPERQYQYKVLSVELDLILTDFADTSFDKINTFTILTLDGGALDVKLNADTNDVITCSDGLKIEGIPITALFWTTETTQIGKTATIFVAWVD